MRMSYWLPEPRLNMNSYLTPLVEELLEFWNGVMIPITVNGSTMDIRVRVAASRVLAERCVVYIMLS